MKLKLDTAFSFAEASNLKDIEKMHQLEKHGFHFKFYYKDNHLSYYACEEPITVEVNTIEDLIALMKKFDCPIILQRDYDTGEPELMLYNDYIE